MFQKLSIRPCKESTSPRVTLKSSFKKKPRKLKLLSDINQLLMVEKGIRSRKDHSINRYVKSDDNQINDYKRNKN